MSNSNLVLFYAKIPTYIAIASFYAAIVCALVGFLHKKAQYSLFQENKNKSWFNYATALSTTAILCMILGWVITQIVTGKSFYS